MMEQKARGPGLRKSPGVANQADRRKRSVLVSESSTQFLGLVLLSAHVSGRPVHCNKS